MIIATRIVCILPSAENPELIGLAREWAKRERMTSVGKKPYLVFVDSDVPSGPGDADTLLLNVDDGKRRGPRSSRLRHLSWQTAHQEAMVAAEVYNLLFMRRDALAIESDPLGLKPLYMASVPGGTLISNNILDLLAIAPELSVPINEMALKQLLTFGYPLGDRTLHSRINRVPTGAAIRWSAGRLAVDRGRRILPALVETNSGENAATRAAQLLEDSIHSRAGGQPVLLGLTGGFDSRTLLGACIAAGVRCDAITYGDPRHSEVKVANAVARLARVKHAVVPISASNVRDNMHLNLLAIEATARPMFTVTNLLPAASTTPQQLLHGYLGDTLGGANLTKWCGRSNLGAPDAIAAKILAANATVSRVVLEFYGLTPDVLDLHANVSVMLTELGGGRHSVVLWDLENRQRRLIANHFRLLSHAFDLSIPYYDAAIIAHYLSLPWARIENRAVTRSMLRRRYTMLARVRHDEEKWPAVPSIFGCVTAFASEVIEKIPALEWRFKAPSIWSAPAQEIVSSREYFLDSVEANYPAILGLLPQLDDFNRATIESFPPNALVQLAYLGEYAEAVAQRCHGAGAR